MIDRITAIIRAELSHPLRRPTLPEVITPETSLEFDLNCGAIDLVCLCVSIEEAFGFDASDSEFEGCHTVGDLCALVERKMEAA